MIEEQRTTIEMILANAKALIDGQTPEGASRAPGSIEMVERAVDAGADREVIDLTSCLVCACAWMIAAFAVALDVSFSQASMIFFRASLAQLTYLQDDILSSSNADGRHN